MAKKAETKTAKPRKVRAWTREDVRMLKALAREKTKTSVIARKPKRSVAAVYLRASKLAVTPPMMCGAASFGPLVGIVDPGQAQGASWGYLRSSTRTPRGRISLRDSEGQGCRGPQGPGRSSASSRDRIGAARRFAAQQGGGPARLPGVRIYDWFRIFIAMRTRSAMLRAPMRSITQAR